MSGNLTEAQVIHRLIDKRLRHIKTKHAQDNMRSCPMEGSLPQQNCDTSKSDDRVDGVFDENDDQGNTTNENLDASSSAAEIGKEFKCGACDFETDEKVWLQFHMKHCHSGVLLACQHEGCGYKVAEMENLKRHAMVHKGMCEAPSQLTCLLSLFGHKLCNVLMSWILVAWFYFNFYFISKYNCKIEHHHSYYFHACRIFWVLG